MTFSGKSPLTYPGAKTLARQDIVEILKCFGAETKGLCSPFMGGASVELHAARQGIEVHASDIPREILICSCDPRRLCASE